MVGVKRALVVVLLQEAHHGQHVQVALVEEILLVATVGHGARLGLRKWAQKILLRCKKCSIAAIVSGTGAHLVQGAQAEQQAVARAGSTGSASFRPSAVFRICSTPR